MIQVGMRFTTETPSNLMDRPSFEVTSYQLPRPRYYARDGSVYVEQGSEFISYIRGDAPGIINRIERGPLWPTQDNIEHEVLLQAGWVLVGEKTARELVQRLDLDWVD